MRSQRDTWGFLGVMLDAFHYPLSLRGTCLCYILLRLPALGDSGNNYYHIPLRPLASGFRVFMTFLLGRGLRLITTASMALFDSI